MITVLKHVEIIKNEQNDQADQTTQNDPVQVQVCYADSIKKKKKENMMIL